MNGKLSFNIDTLSTLELANVYTWVFVDGLLLENKPNVYEIVNTAYGTKLFINPQFVANNSRIAVAVNRKYNSRKDIITHDVTTKTNSITKVFSGDQLGEFYHHKYVKVYVRRTNIRSRRSNADEGKLATGAKFATLDKNSEVYKVASSFQEIPREFYQTQIDNSGRNVLLNIRNFNFLPGDVIYIMNAVNYFELHETVSFTQSNMIKEFPLMENYNGDIRPIAFGGVEDFDVFINGYHLVPGKHFTIIKGGNGVAPFKLRLLFSPTKSGSYRIDIYKNEAVIDDSDTVIVRKKVFLIGA